MRRQSEEAAMTTVGVRELRERLSKYLRRVADGERLVVTQRGEPVALLIPPNPVGQEYGLRALVDEGLVSWSGEKPRGAQDPDTVKGGTLAQTVIEDRR
jgi:prevent-host-death family protein